MLSHRPSMRGQKIRSPVGASGAVTPNVPKPQISRRSDHHFQPTTSISVFHRLITSHKMAPNQRIIPSGSRPQKSFFSTAYNEATNPENKTIVRSIIVFGVCFIISVWILPAFHITNEWLLRPVLRSFPPASESSSFLRKSTLTRIHR
jgi:hypothetical protein